MVCGHSRYGKVTRLHVVTRSASSSRDNTLDQTNLIISNLNSNLQLSALRTQMTLERLGEEIDETKEAIGQTSANIGSSFDGLASNILIIGGVVVGGVVFFQMQNQRK